MNGVSSAAKQPNVFLMIKYPYLNRKLVFIPAFIMSNVSITHAVLDKETSRLIGYQNTILLKIHSYYLDK